MKMNRRKCTNRQGKGREMRYPLFGEAVTGVVAETFSRHGGRSDGLFAENNIGCNVGDEMEKVLANRRRIKERLRLQYLVSADQVHGDRVVSLADIESDTEVQACDALMTDQEGVGLMIGHADCQAVLLFDPVRMVIGAVHSGWRGSAANIVAKTIAAMEETYGCHPFDLVAGISPSLGPCCAEFVNFRTELPETFLAYQVGENYFDFWRITERQLLDSGVNRHNISCTSICTSCSEDFFSYRRACRESGGVTGRNGSVIGLRES